MVSVNASGTSSQPQMPHVFISYKHTEPDRQVAHNLRDLLEQSNCTVFVDTTLQVGQDWSSRIDQDIRASDFLVVLLSEASAGSPMVMGEIRRALRHYEQQGHPRILPVRIAYNGMLPYAVDAHIGLLQYTTWQSPADDDRVGRDLLAAIAGTLPQPTVGQHEPSATGAVEQISGAQKQDLISALLACSTMADPGLRSAVIDDLRPAIRTSIRRHNVARVEVRNVVTRCLDFVGGLEDLVELVRSYESDSQPMQGVDAIMQRIAAY